MLLDTNLAKEIVLNNAISQQFPPHYRFDTHFHRSVELLLCKSGTISFAIQGNEQILNPGQYIVVFPNVPHDTAAPSDTTAEALHIHFHIKSACSLYEKQCPDGELPFLTELLLNRRPFFRDTCSAQLQACLECIFDEFHNSGQYSDRLMQLYREQLVLLLSRDLLAQCPANSDLYGNSYLMAAILYINQHCSEKLVVEQIAGHAGVSPRYLTKLFQKYLDLSISSYITFIRISKSIDYKCSHPSATMAEVATEFGFSSQQHFSTAFKNTMGITPRNYFLERVASDKFR
ncbi:hypothetical protein HMPREF0866_00168 [Ruminococcaceae bacterium D16]|nr:hypothetical protein HMPREF0866_00168 [Ruminococcaceae bacterium D16]